MSAPSSASMILSESSSAALPAPHVRVRARAQAAGQLDPELQLDRRVGELQGLHVGVGGDELNALDARGDHAVDRVVAAAADADDLDARALRGFVLVVDADVFCGLARHGGEGSFRGKMFAR
jgi:hypothetical protein